MPFKAHQYYIITAVFSRMDKNKNTGQIKD